MTSNPVKGPSPSDPIKGYNDETKTSSNPHRKIEKVEKVGEVDPEQQSRARKFRSLVDEDSAEDTKDSNLPSPIDLFSTDEKPKLGSKPSLSADESAEIIPSPTYSPPPTVKSNPAKEETDEPPLPRSDDFWTHIDEPLQNEASPKPMLKEKSQPFHESTGKSKKDKENFHPSSHLGIPIKEPSPYDPSHQISSEKKEKIARAKTEEETLPPIPPSLREDIKHLKEPNSPMSRHLSKEEEKGIIPNLPEEKKRWDSEKVPEKKKNNSQEPTKSVSQQDPNVAWTFGPSFEEKEDRKGEKKEEDSLEITAPSSHPLPAEIIPIATAATAAAMPYLKPETFSLFYQMVGTIYVMATPPGVTRTEIVLNATSYSQSKFYGASIIIEKYATAPDSFNIRLTGSNEAVAAFNKNIPNLMAAFQKGNFSFGIGRIEAEYKDEKPLFRRKEKKEGKDFGGSFTDKER